jgi:hypothetical protein
VIARWTKGIAYVKLKQMKKIKKWWSKKNPTEKNIIAWQWIMLFTLTGMVLLSIIIK